MARIRTVKPELFTHEQLYEAEKQTGLPLRFAFVGLFTQADREGRFKWRPRTLKLGVLPHDEIDFARVLDALLTRGFIRKYASPTGEILGFIPTFGLHQQINNREGASDLPDPSQCVDLSNEKDACPTRAERVADACPTRHEGKGREGKGKEGENLNLKTVEEATAAESLTHAQIDDADQKGKAPETRRAVAIAVRLRRAGILGANASNPHLIEWADNPAVTDDMLDAAAQMAKARTARPGPNYLVPIIAELLDPPKPKPKQDDWQRSDAGISRKANELGVSARAGESYQSLKSRLFDEISRREHGNGAAA
jgi:hypothetical protein